MSLLQRLNKVELPVCLYFNRINHKQAVSRLFSIVSRLGDGVFWYVLIALLPLFYGVEAWWVSFLMLLTGGISLAVYKFLKVATERHRPFMMSNNIFQNVAALDLYSFPSGHTMHAVGFSTVLLSFYPQWAVLVLPFASLVAVSRLVLGLHYPSDVLVGAGIGFSIAMLVVSVLG
ncbi:MAG: phosphatase PAP2 family protein [Thiotrichales bacterium]